MKKNYKMVIIGSREYLARHLISLLLEKGIAPENIIPLDLRQYNKEQLIIKGKIFTIRPLDEFHFNGKCIVFLCKANVVFDHKRKELKKESYLIDCTGLLKKAPCIIPSLNKDKIFSCPDRMLCNPTSLAIILTVVLSALKKEAPLKNANATVLLSTSEFGRKMSKALWDQTRAFYTQEELTLSDMDYKIAFNIIVNISEKLTERSAQQIHCLAGVPVFLSTALVPVFEGHCFHLQITFQHQISLSKITQLLRQNPMIDVLDTPPDLTITPIDTFLKNKLYIIHLQKNNCMKNTYSCWIIGNNLSFGTALNAVQIAMEIIKKMPL